MTSRTLGFASVLFLTSALILTSASANFAPAQAPPAQNPANGNWYAEIPVNNFIEARAIAAVAGGFIADLVDPAEQQWVVGEFGDGVSTFIGLTDEVTPGVFLWESGAPLINPDWAPGQPTGSTTSRYVRRFTSWTTGNGSSAVRALIETPTQITTAVPTITCTPAIGEMSLTFEAPGFTGVSIVRDNVLIATLPMAMGTYVDLVAPGTHSYAIVGTSPTSVSLPGRCQGVIPDPDYRFHIPDVAVPITAAAVAPVLLDAIGGASTSFSLGVCYDPMLLGLTGAAEGNAVVTLTGGGADVWLTTITGEGIAIAAVYSLTGGVFLGPGLDLELARLTFEPTGQTLLGVPNEVRPCSDEVGTPPVQAVVAVNGASIPAVLDAGSVTFFEEMFRRGDTNVDGNVDIADPLFLGARLFDPAVNDFPCREACDVNGDEQVDIADMISIVSFLFIGGAAPVAPFPDCGVDSDPASSFGCDAGGSCP